MNIILIGPPGSGKGTQIQEMKKYLDVVVISTGDIARDLAKNDEAVRKNMERGELISDETLVGEIDKRLDDVTQGKTIIFDGFPRNLPQAEKLEHLMLEHNLTIDRAIYIVLDEEEVVKRLTARKVCSQCGQPMFGEKCPACGGSPASRSDDNKETIINRMQVFLDKTMPLVSYYKNKSILKEVNGQQSVEGVAADIKQAVL